jgi:hypothetical protein
VIDIKLRFKNGKNLLKRFSKQESIELVKGFVLQGYDFEDLKNVYLELHSMGFPPVKLKDSKMLSDYFQSD